MERVAAERAGTVGGPWAEDAARALVNTTLLPHVLERQVGLCTHMLMRWLVVDSIKRHTVLLCMWGCERGRVRWPIGG